MRNKKDISEETNTSATAGMSLSNDTENTPNASLASIFKKKSERIATAFYLITDFFPKDEPLRRELRETSLALLHLGTHQGQKSDLFDKGQNHLLYLISLWNLAYYSGHVSETNFEVVKAELFAEVARLKKEDGRKEASFFPSSFFLLPSEEASQETHESRSRFDILNAEQRSRENIWERDEAFYHSLEELTKEKRNDLEKLEGNIGGFYKTKKREASAGTKGHFSDRQNQATSPDRKNASRTKRQNTSSPLSQGGGQTKPKARGQIRREAILEVVRKHGDVGIKDIGDVVGGCSQKTLQRELTALVTEGVLLKKGERRWSRYSLR